VTSQSQPDGRRRVVHVVAPAPYGGLETVVRALANASRERGRDVAVAILLQDGAPHPFAERLKADGVAVREIRCGRRRYLAEIRELELVLRETGATVVHAHNYHADVVGWAAARRCGVPVVSTVHGFSSSDWKGKAYEWLDIQFLKRFDAVICVSEQTEAIMRRAGCREGRVFLVRNGHWAPPALPRADARRRLGLDDGALVVGWVGRLSVEKGADLLLDALARGGTMPACEVVLVGDGPERAALEARARASGTGRGAALARVRFAGRRDDAPTLVSAFDVLALSSRREGTPMVVLEAMAAGVPVVAFGVGGVPQVVDETTGWLVPPEDVAGFAAGLAEALTRPRDAARRAEAATRRLAERFGADEWLERTDAVYAAAERA